MSLLTEPIETSASTVAAVMSVALVAAELTTTVTVAATLMGVHGVGSVVVLTDGSLAGIFTDRDVRRAVTVHADGADDLIEYWMTTNPATICSGATLAEALAVMIAGGFRHLPVVEAETLIGLVSMRDLCRTDARLGCSTVCARRAG